MVDNVLAALVVYDITSRDSFNEVKAWLTSVRGNSTNKALTVALVGNKSDLDSERQVQQVEGATLARESGLLFFETSAKTGENVEEAFLQTARSIMRKLDQGLIDVEGILLPTFGLYSTLTLYQMLVLACA